jgi:hypothetical protein
MKTRTKIGLAVILVVGFLGFISVAQKLYAQEQEITNRKLFDEEVIYYTELAKSGTYVSMRHGEKHYRITVYSGLGNVGRREEIQECRVSREQLRFQLTQDLVPRVNLEGFMVSNDCAIWVDESTMCIALASSSSGNFVSWWSPSLYVSRWPGWG